MYENQTFEEILERMLTRVPDTVDKREGSIIYTACAPAAWELASMYAELEVNMNLSFADTATGEYLSRRVAEFGIQRKLATKAKRKAVFRREDGTYLDVPLGSRYGGGDVNYIVRKRLGEGQYEVEAEVAGIVGNEYFGALLPIDYIEHLAQAELVEVLVPGEDIEDDETLRKRYFEAVNQPAFGGNISDYKQEIGAMDGVGAVKVFPVWQGGGTVKCTVMTSDWSAPPKSMIDEIQTIVDPIQNGGKGIGLAPIGHKVTISPVQEVPITVTTKVILDTGVTIGQIQNAVENVIKTYMLNLKKTWANTDKIIVRVALIEAAILTVSGIIDVSETKLNGDSANFELGAEEIPKMGAVTVNV